MATQKLSNLTGAALAKALTSTTTPSPTGYRSSACELFKAVDPYEPTLRFAVDEAIRFVEDCRREKHERENHRPEDCILDLARWLTLTGVCGCGKTKIARIAFDAAAECNPGNAAVWLQPTAEYSDRHRRPQSVWMTATEFAQRLRDGEYDLPERLAVDYLVAIDDVGASRDTTAFIAEALYRLANVRLGKWTIFTSNLSLAEIGKQIDQRVSSRMIRDANVAIRIKAGDYAEYSKGVRP